MFGILLEVRVDRWFWWFWWWWWWRRRRRRRRRGESSDGTGGNQRCRRREGLPAEGEHQAGVRRKAEGARCLSSRASAVKLRGRGKREFGCSTARVLAKQQTARESLKRVILAQTGRGLYLAGCGGARGATAFKTPALFRRRFRAASVWTE